MDLPEGEPQGSPPREPSTAIPQPGEVFDGKYRIERTIGLGGMAAVLEATHLHLDDRVAIKVLLPQWTEAPEVVDRFMREGRAATKIRSEHVVRVLDVGMVEKHPYLVMEYLHGSDLDQLIAQNGPLGPSDAVDYILQACEAIAEAHAIGMVHRDLKPANLFLTRRADGSSCVKVLDFGISKATQSATKVTTETQPTTVMGSPHYMSPEQLASSRDVDARSDVWALGAIVHELLAGVPPFDGATLASLSAAILRDPAPPLTSLRSDVPMGIEVAVLRCLEKEPARRFANVAELALALSDFGSASAHASAERIVRVLEGGTGKVSVARPAPIEAKGAVATLGTTTRFGTTTARSRMFGYVVGVVALLGVSFGIGSMIVSRQHAARDAEAREEAERNGAALSASAGAGGSAMPGASAVPSASVAANAANAPNPNEAVHKSSPDLAASTHVLADAGHPRASVPPARGPKRGPVHGGPRTKPGKNDPLPDFPVPNVGKDEQPPEPPAAPALPPANP